MSSGISKTFITYVLLFPLLWPNTWAKAIYVTNGLFWPMEGKSWQSLWYGQMQLGFPTSQQTRRQGKERTGEDQCSSFPLFFVLRAQAYIRAIYLQLCLPSWLNLSENVLKGTPRSASPRWFLAQWLLIIMRLLSLLRGVLLDEHHLRLTWSTVSLRKIK